ncbi:DUF2971 domain-containing protein [Paucibacter sp. AS339]|uniref:DUF2971 domain-containing protein n=1 Tax=Paucibacter hankyongi TaxID=3133434 RepID=UPI00309745F9
MYKYLSLDAASFEYTRQALVSRRLFYQSPIKFNDPFDCAPAHDVSDTTEEQLVAASASGLIRGGASLLDALELSLSSLPTLKHRVLGPKSGPERNSLLRKTLSEQLGVLCLSTHGKHALMWAHYASKHQGICLCFNGKHDFFGHTHQVSYSTARPIIRTFHQPAEEAEEQERIQRTLLTKHDVWKYEGEWRDIRFPPDLSTYDQGVRTYPSEVLKGVILGAEISDANRLQVAEWVSEAAPKAQVWQLRLDHSSFALKADRVRLAKRNAWCFSQA